MQKFLYLALDLGSLLIPLLFSFSPRMHFASTWRAWLPALVYPAVAFVLWDVWFTSMRVWGFNENYVTGWRIGRLPIEEILFFFCIPYATLFIYATVSHLKTDDPFHDQGRRLTWLLIVGLIAVGIKHYDRWYTVVTFASLALFLLILNTRLKPSYLGRFYFSYVFILIPFFLVNGVLTGSWIDRPVVWYNDEENLGIRIGTIPFEDTFYGMLLILMNVVIYEHHLKRSGQRDPS